jgi:hypothetical protein
MARKIIQCLRKSPQTSVAALYERRWQMKSLKNRGGHRPPLQPKMICRGLLWNYADDKSGSGAIPGGKSIETQTMAELAGGMPALPGALFVWSAAARSRSAWICFSQPPWMRIPALR